MNDDALLSALLALQNARDLSGIYDLYHRASEIQRSLIRDSILLFVNGSLEKTQTSHSYRGSKKLRVLSSVAPRPEVFRDTGISIYAFIDQFLVVCEKCTGMAEVRTVERSRNAPTALYESRIICKKCGTTKVWEDKSRDHGALNAIRDPYFHRPLWLQTPCCGNTLWAFNARHVDILEQFVSAKLRESASTFRSMVSSLPKWIQAAKNRKNVSTGLRRLREKLMV